MNKQVVLIMTDTQRKDMITCYNKEQDMNTPYIDSIAENGIKFENAYCAQPVCGPARSSIFTGYYPHTNSNLANSMYLGAGIKTIGERLTSNDIKTGYIGKWHLDGGDYFGDGICPNGWSDKYWFDMRRYLDDMSEEDRIRSRQFSTVYDDGVLPKFTFAHQCTNKAIQFIEEHKNEDFFLVVSYDEPHGPSLAPEEYFEQFKNRKHIDYGNLRVDREKLPEHIKIRVPENLDDKDFSRYELLGCNAYVDKEIGRVLNCIREETSNPCIIYTSDHGTSLGAHGFDGKGPAMFEEITNIPFIVEWKDKINATADVNAPISHVDIVPTLLDIFNIEIPKNLEGNTLIPLLNEGKKVNDYVFMEFTRYEIDHDGFGGFQPIRCITDGEYKLVINLLTEDEFYHLQNDKGEVTNLIQNVKYEKKRNELHDKLLDWMNETRDPFRGYYWERRVWRKDAKEASWDYTGMTRQRLTEKDEVTQLDYNTGLPIEGNVRKKD